jgi:hypothetical protein
MTGPPNNTGVYQLDLTAINNFTLAWQPLSVETDIFCSAGITLPDKAGRQMTVGGWSAPSTYGLRLYTPDGSPGVWGPNNWIEDPGVVMLQRGRWYPSAAIMANGSVIVVGGEQGSNGAPEPSIEILPNGGPPLDMPWLLATDPMNLYPFLIVLPSGGLFVGFFNQALRLDENTFATTGTYPIMPGSLNNDANSGRTYPLEGTMVIMPQYHPYTDPLTVMTCGGSTNPTGLALDSCITIQPEAPGAQWQLERMPSKRVMPCIAALPDGTYLIANGAEQGVAGFGLANTPNLNALLYDPTLPFGQRISVMANTTVARLYHSEAILLLDGRVLISGSDPEDNVNPEEYRVEVFTPPYLLSGLPKPTFTLGSTDWEYNAPVSFTLTSGSTANLKVSMLGVVTSTHGNSMGQRTLFPAFTCSGTSCTITTPTNAHIAPPGWYIIFVLDGPTPSVGQHVRIGGDPAAFGLWPTDPKFAPLPGI